MSNLPTLLRKGFIVPPKGMSDSDKKKLNDTVSIDYILNFISNRIPEKKGSRIKTPPKKYGDKVIILKSETGSGKSTTLPSKLYTAFFEKTRKNIIVTQPRVLTAIDIPSTIVPFVPELELDKNIGYNTQNFKRLPKEKGIIFSTVGVLTQQLIMSEDEEFMKKYQFIIIDEVHERDIDTDLCLFMLKKLLQDNYENPECPLVILTSATFDEKIFMEYFNTPKENYIQVVGSTFPIEPNFPEYSISNYIQYATLKAQKLHLDNLSDIDNGDKFRDIIIFVQGTAIGRKIYDDLMVFNSNILSQDYKTIMKYNAELENTLTALEKKGGGEKQNYFILPILLDKKNFEKGGLQYQNLFSSLETINVPLWERSKKINLDSPPKKYVIPSRRIIIATNIAETGVTIPTLKYCIDTGYHFNVEYHPNFGCSAMFPKNVTRGMAIQRRGRVGRKAPGFWFPCYTEETFNALQADNFSKIIIDDTAANLLSILIKEKGVEIIEETTLSKIKNKKTYNLFQTFSLTSNSWYSIKNKYETNMSSLDFIELPSVQMLEYSLEKLHILGFIDDKYDITVLGYYANQIRFLSLELKKMIFSGYHYGANILDLITIASFIHIQKRLIFSKDFKLSNFLKQNDTEFDFYNRVLIADDFINCIFVWNIFQSFIEKNMLEINSSILEKLNTDDTPHKKVLYIKNIKKWCDENGILYDGLVNVMAMRDSIIENMINAGLNPYKNSLGLQKNLYNLNKIMRENLAEGLDEIRKLKYCIFEGYKCNILVLRKDNYTSLLKNITIKVKSNYIEFENNKPQALIVDSYNLSQKFNSALFEFVANGFISVLDNYIEIDNRIFLN